MLIDKEKVVNLLNLKKTGNKGWYLSSEDCPYCGKPKHLAVIFDSSVPSFVCKRCDEKGVLSKLLFKLNRADLVQFGRVTDLESQFDKNLISADLSEEELDYKLPKVSLPIGFKRINYDPYLEKRGFTPEQYEVFGVGESKLDDRVSDDYVIFVVKDINNLNVGYVGRKRASKEEISSANKKIKEYNEKAKVSGLKLKKVILRYVNSENDFQKMLFGCNEIVKGSTKTVIIVEGITDKASVDRLLNLYKQTSIKCCATFSNKISKYQIKILQDLGIENIILLYDSDSYTLNLNKKAALDLKRYFNVSVGYTDSGREPGEFDLEELSNILSTLEDPIEYFYNKIQI